MRGDEAGLDDLVYATDGDVGLNLEALAVKAPKIVGVAGDGQPCEGCGQFLLLLAGAICPGGTERERRHDRQVERALDDRCQLMEPLRHRQRWRCLHRGEQGVIETLDLSRCRIEHSVSRANEQRPSHELKQEWS